MKLSYLLFVLLFLLTSTAIAQLKVGDNPDEIDGASLLELESRSSYACKHIPDAKDKTFGGGFGL